MKAKRNLGYSSAMGLKKIFAAAVLAFAALSGLAVLAASGARADPAFLRTIAALDEPRGYCIDIRGQGANLRPNDSLQAHTCKLSNWVDMLIDDGLGPAPGPLIMPEYGQCIAASSPTPGGELMLGACADDPNQMWVHTAAGHIQPAQAPELCLTLAGGRGLNAGGVQYLRLAVALAPCDAAAADRQTWAFQTPD